MVNSIQRKALIIEDEPIIQKIHRFFLEGMGYEVDIAENGQKGLSLFATHQYDFILLDIGLPDMTGIEVAAAIRSREDNSTHIPIIAATAYMQEELRNQSLLTNFDEIVNKPVDCNKLQKLVRHFVGN